MNFAYRRRVIDPPLQWHKTGRNQWFRPVQSVKEPQFSLSENWGLGVSGAKYK